MASSILWCKIFLYPLSLSYYKIWEVFSAPSDVVKVLAIFFSKASVFLKGTI